MDHFLGHPGDAAPFSVALTAAAFAELPTRSTPAGPGVPVPLVLGVNCRARTWPLVPHAPG